MSAIAQRAGLGSESLYKAFAHRRQPCSVAVLKTFHSVGVKLTASAV